MCGLLQCGKSTQRVRKEQRKITLRTGHAVICDDNEGEKGKGEGESEGEGEVVEDGKSPPSLWE